MSSLPVGWLLRDAKHGLSVEKPCWPASPDAGSIPAASTSFFKRGGRIAMRRFLFLGVLVGFFLITMCVGSHAFTVWVDAYGRPCDVVCGSRGLKPVVSGIYVNGEKFFVCAANARGEGYRAGYNLRPSWADKCVVGWGGREMSVRPYRCLCEGTRRMSGYVHEGSAMGRPRYLGCFKDQGDPSGTRGRDLSGYVFSSPRMTVSLCISECRRRGFAYAGVQYGSQCFCGNSYGKYGRANNCDMPCSGNRSQICGGFWANSVYSTR